MIRPSRPFGRDFPRVYRFGCWSIRSVGWSSRCGCGRMTPDANLLNVRCVLLAGRSAWRSLFLSAS